MRDPEYDGTGNRLGKLLDSPFIPRSLSWCAWLRVAVEGPNGKFWHDSTRFVFKRELERLHPVIPRSRLVLRWLEAGEEPFIDVTWPDKTPRLRRMYSIHVRVPIDWLSRIWACGHSAVQARGRHSPDLVLDIQGRRAFYVRVSNRKYERTVGVVVLTR